LIVSNHLIIQLNPRVSIKRTILDAYEKPKIKAVFETKKNESYAPFQTLCPLPIEHASAIHGPNELIDVASLFLAATRSSLQDQSFEASQLFGARATVNRMKYPQCTRNDAPPCKRDVTTF
jgi:hypothetical protein